MVARLTNHTGATKMYFMGLVNSTFMAKKPTGHVELVALSEEMPVERYKDWAISNDHNICGYGCRDCRAGIEGLGPSASPRRRAIEEQPADLCMEPLFQLVRESDSSDSSEGDTSLVAHKLRMHILHETKAMPSSLEKAPVEVMDKGLENEKDLYQEGSSCTNKRSDMVQAEEPVSEMTTASNTTIISKIRSTPKLESIFADGRLSTRVQHHPLLLVREEHEENARARTKTRGITSASPAVRDVTVESPPKTDEALARVLQHPLQGTVEDSVKARKLIAKIQGKSAELSQQAGRKMVRNSKILPEPQPDERSRDKLQERRIAAIATTKNSNLVRDNAGSDEEEEPVSLNYPVMEKIEGRSSPLLPRLLQKRLQNLPKLAVTSEDTKPVLEERELRHSSPILTQLDVQDELSFRVWEQEPVPKRKTISISRDFQELDLDAGDEHAKPKDVKSTVLNNERGSVVKSRGSLSRKDVSVTVNSSETTEVFQPLEVSLPAFVNLNTFSQLNRKATPNVDVNTRHCKEELQHDYPSPSSFICGTSPKSLFSDDDSMFSRFQQFPNFDASEVALPVCKSPRSVLSQEPDEISHCMSDSSETLDNRPLHAAAATLSCNDEASDLESPMKCKNVDAVYKQRPFSKSAYAGKKTLCARSLDEENPDRARNGAALVDEDVADLSDLRYFHEAEQREPWLEKNGGVLDDTDLDFLLPTDFEELDATSPALDAVESINSEVMLNSPTKPKGQNTWMKFVDVQSRGLNDSPEATKHRHNRSSSFRRSSIEKQIPPRPPKRSVKFAPELVREPSTFKSSNRPKPKPALSLLKLEPATLKDDDEHIYPSVKSWEVEEKEEQSTPTSSSRSSRRWRRHRELPNVSGDLSANSPNSPQGEIEPEDSPSILISRRRWRRFRDEWKATSPGDSTKSGWSSSYEPRHLSRRHRIVQIMPCAGKLFSWPHRHAHLKTSRRGSLVDSDNESSTVGEESFGRSARRDAQQVRRILKGGQKHFPKVTVAEILQESFAS